MSPVDREIVTQIYVNMGKAIAAYERLLQPGHSRFDAYVTTVLNGDYQAAQTILTPDEVTGLRIFIGKGNCIDCHNGPLFTNNDFHNTGVPAAAGLPEDVGRALGVQQVLANEFNCLSAHSGVDPAQCAGLRFLVADGHNLVRQFKPPSLRNVAERAPYMHAGQIAALEAVVAHYNNAPAAPTGHSELEPLQLSSQEMAQLVAFLQTLSGPLNTAPAWLQPPVAVGTVK